MSLSVCLYRPSSLIPYFSTSSSSYQGQPVVLLASLSSCCVLSDCFLELADASLLTCTVALPTAMDELASITV